MVIDLRKLEQELWETVIKHPEGEVLSRRVAQLILENRIDQELNAVALTELEKELVLVKGV